MILVLTSGGDEHAERVVGALAGTDVTVFDPAEFPADATLEIGHPGDGSAVAGAVSCSTS